MRLLLVTLFVSFAVVCGPLGDAVAQNHYVGVKRCKRCHNKASTGKQIKVWKSNEHAKAIEVLSSTKAMKVAKKLGVKDPTTDAKCLKCHETGHGKEKSELGKSFRFGLGVQCESCHGPGEEHFRIRFEAQQEDDDEDEDEDGDDEEDGENASDVLMSLPKGEVTPITEKTCTACHNKDSPTYKPFCYCERLEEIAHWDPRREKVRGKKALAKRPCPCK